MPVHSIDTLYMQRSQLVDTQIPATCMCCYVCAVVYVLLCMHCYMYVLLCMCCYMYVCVVVYVLLHVCMCCYVCVLCMCCYVCVLCMCCYVCVVMYVLLCMCCYVCTHIAFATNINWLPLPIDHLHVHVYQLVAPINWSGDRGDHVIGVIM